MPKANLDKKQQIVAVLLTGVLGVLGWQVYSAFFSSPPAAAPATPTPQNAAGKTSPAVPNASNVASTSTSSAGGSPAATTGVGSIDDPYQKKYLQLMEVYKIMELQKMIAADKQAIAAAQASTAESLSKITQLGGQPGDVFADIPGDSSIAKPGAVDDAFSLVYTGLQDGNWTATVKIGDASYDVSIGTTINGKYKVTAIDNNGVVLQAKDTVWHISFDGSTSTPLAESTAAATPTNAPVAVLPVKNPSVVATKVVNQPSAPKSTSVQGITQTPALPEQPHAAVVVPMPPLVSKASGDHVKLPAMVTPPMPAMKPAVIAAPATPASIMSDAMHRQPAPVMPSKTSALVEKTSTVLHDAEQKTKALAEDLSTHVPGETPWYQKAWGKVKTMFSSEDKLDKHSEGIPSIELKPRAIPPAPSMPAAMNQSNADLQPKVNSAALIPTMPVDDFKKLAAPVVSDPTIVHQPAVSAAAKPAVIPVVSQPATAVAKPVVDTAKTSGPLDGLDSSHFTIQAAILASEDQVREFIRDHHLTKYFIYKDAQGRYGVAVGDYPTRQVASAALNDVSQKDLKRSGAYIVSAADLKKKAKADVQLFN